MITEPNRTEEVFSGALQREAGPERAAFLDGICGDDAALREHVEALLSANDSAGAFLESPVQGGMATADGSCVLEKTGTMIGPYKLLEMIGEGGFGAVYMAEQEKPIRRRVALKIIKLGMDTKQVVARFEAERQSLAIMDHPNIAKVFEAGATDSGRPYFAMELVTGISIIDYCDNNRLSTRERLDLFIQVCNAIQHAHQKGIIHRDIKPSNVMVAMHDSRPVPKVIDFGIAKAIDQRLTEKTLFTQYAHMIGTPAYMSPEQAEMNSFDIDTRSDIYSLGVLLYELLTGATPLSAEELRKAGFAEMQRIIREEEPALPSTRLSTMGEMLTTVAQQRKAHPDVLKRLMRSDLDWIVMKSLEKDRTRRYATASELTADIERHLNSEPVLARPPSKTYRLKKCLCKYRTQAIAAVTAAILLGGLAVISVMYIQAVNRGEKAKFLEHKGILSQVRESFSQWDMATALKQVEPILDSEYVGPDARLLYASILIDGGHPEQAEAELQKLVKEHPKVAGVAHLMLVRIYWESDLGEAEKVQKIDAHRQRSEALLPESAEAYFLQAITTPMVEEKLGHLSRALKLDPGHYESRKLRTWTHYASRNYEDMEDDALCMTISRPKTMQGYSLLGIAQREQRKFEKALESFGQALRFVGTEDMQRLDLYRQRCETYLHWGDYHRLISEVQACSTQFASEPRFAFYLFCAHVGLGEYDDAISVFQKAVHADPNNKGELVNWSMKHVSDTLAVGQPWHPAGALPEEVPFIWMQEVEKNYRGYVSKGAERIITDGFGAVWSPDGRKLAFSVGFKGYSGVALYDRQTKRTKLLIVPGKDPAWSPDGKHIAFVRDCQILPLSQFASAEREDQHRSRKQEEVWIMRADGTEPRRLARGANWPRWSPDSEHVFYQSWPDRMLYKISVKKTSAAPELICSVVTYASVSPDVQYMTYVNRRYDKYLHELHVVELSSPEKIIWRRTVHPTVWGGHWSPKGDQLYTIAWHSTGRYPAGLWIYDLRSGRATKLLTGWACEGCFWSPDEKHLGFILGPPLHEIWVAPTTSLGSGQTEREHHREAIAYYTRLIEVEPSEEMNYAWRAVHWVYLGDHEKALEDVAILVQNNSREVPSLCNGLARLLMGLENPVDQEVAVRLVQTAEEHAQAEESVYWKAATATTLAEAHYLAARWDKVIEALNEKVNASQANASDYFCLAMAHWRLEEREEARKWYERGVEEWKTRRIFCRVPHFRTEAEALLGIKQERDGPHLP